MEEAIGTHLHTGRSSTTTKETQAENPYSAPRDSNTLKSDSPLEADSSQVSATLPISSHSARSEAESPTEATSNQTWCDLFSINKKLSKKGEAFLLDSGEWCVKIPDSVITKHQHRWDNFILAQFQGKAPTAGALHAIANGIWSKRLRDISVSKLSERSFLIKIPNRETRLRVLAQGMWHIEGQSMFVGKWEPGLSPKIPILTSAPVWLDFRGVPLQFFNEEGLEHVAGIIGDPKFLHPATANMTNLEYARVFTVIDLTKPLPEAINVQFQSGEIHRVEVSSPWLPPTCDFCNEVGHSLKRCPKAPITCIDCNSSGHKLEECPRRKKVVDQQRLEQTKSKVKAKSRKKISKNEESLPIHPQGKVSISKRREEGSKPPRSSKSHLTDKSEIRTPKKSSKTKETKWIEKRNDKGIQASSSSESESDPDSESDTGQASDSSHHLNGSSTDQHCVSSPEDVSSDSQEEPFQVVQSKRKKKLAKQGRIRGNGQNHL